MPEELKNAIKKLPLIERNQVWVSCKGLRGTDEESIKNIEYVGGRGFPGYYYPYMNTQGYLSPVIPVQLNVASM